VKALVENTSGCGLARSIGQTQAGEERGFPAGRQENCMPAVCSRVRQGYSRRCSPHGWVNGLCSGRKIGRTTHSPCSPGAALIQRQKPSSPAQEEEPGSSLRTAHYPRILKDIFRRAGEVSAEPCPIPASPCQFGSKMGCSRSSPCIAGSGEDFVGEAVPKKTQEKPQTNPLLQINYKLNLFPLQKD